MIEKKRRRVLMHVTAVLGLGLLLALGVFLSLKYQSRAVEIEIEAHSGAVDTKTEERLGLAENLAANLLTNRSFEPPTSTTNVCQDGPAPHGWDCYVWQGSAALQWDPNIAFSGTHSVRIFGLGDEAGAAWFTEPRFTITAGQQYSFSGWIKADYMAQGARALLAIHFFDGDGHVVGYYESNRVLHSTLSEPNDGWVQVKGSAAAPEDPRAVEARLDAKLVGAGYVHFDDVIVSEGPIEPFLLLNVSASPVPVSSTGTLTYVVNVTNTGGSPAHSVCVTSTLDNRATLVYSYTDQPSTYMQTDRAHIWCSENDLPEGRGSLAVTPVVTIDARTTAHIDLLSTFEVSADSVETISLTKKTPFIKSCDFKLSNFEYGWAAPGVTIDYVHIVTNTSNYPISFTNSSLLVDPDDCAFSSAHPESTGPVPAGETTPVTLTFTPNISPPADCLAVLSVIASCNHQKISKCKTHVISDWLGLDVFGSSDLVHDGEELTYTLSYTYVGGINAQDLRISVTLAGPAELGSPTPLADDPGAKKTYVWTPPPKRFGDTGTINVVASIPTGSTGLVTCTAQIETLYAGPITQVITTAIAAPDFEITSCGPGYAAPGVALHYAHLITNTGNYPISFTLSAHTIPITCGVAVAQPQNTAPVPNSQSVSATLTFTPNQLSRPCVCTPTLEVQAETIPPKTASCKTFVLTTPLSLTIVGGPNPAHPGEEINYTLAYTYAGGVNAENLQITFTLDGPAVIIDSNPTPDLGSSDQTYVWSPPPSSIGGTGKTAVTALPTSTGIVTGIAQLATRYAGVIRKPIVIEIANYNIYLPTVFDHYPLESKWYDQNDEALTSNDTVYALTSCDNGTLFAGTGKGIYRRGQGDREWALEKPTSDNVRGLAASPDCTLVFAAIMNAGIHRRSADTWGLVSPPGMEKARTVALSGSTVLAGGDFGIRYSLDGGNTWNPTSINEVTINLTWNTNRVYAALWGNGVYYSEGGDFAHWYPLNPGLPVAYLYALYVADWPPDDTPEFVGMDDSFYRWVGSQWMRDLGLPWWVSTRTFWFTKDSTTIYAGQENNGVMRSTDDGLTWEQMNTGWIRPDQVRTLLILQDYRKWLYAGTSEGVWRHPLPDP